MKNNKIYESVGSSYGDDWMAQERRYEAKHSPWALDDNAAYLDEEHRRHCEAREARREHERQCEVERPQPVPKRAPVSRSQSARTAPAPGKVVGIFFAMIAIFVTMSIISVFIQIFLSLWR